MKKQAFIFLHFNELWDFTRMSFSYQWHKSFDLGICQLSSTYENHPGGYITKWLRLSESYEKPLGQNKFISTAALQTTNT